MLSSQISRPHLLRRLLEARRIRTTSREALDGAPWALAMICPRCRLPMRSAGSSAEERLEDGEPYLRHRWRCGRCRTGASL
jgi:hypothetical protein